MFCQLLQLYSAEAAVGGSVAGLREHGTAWTAKAYE